MSSILILDGETGLRCTEQEKPVPFDLASDPIMRGVAEQLWLWLGGDYVKLKNLYHLQVTDENTLVVSPKDNSVSDYISSVAITFDGTTRQPSTVEIVEPGGDLTRIIFRSYSLNPSLPDSLFKKCTIDD